MTDQPTTREALLTERANLDAAPALAAGWRMAVTTQMVDAAWNAGKNRRMSGLPSDFRAVLEAAISVSPAQPAEKGDEREARPAGPRFAIEHDGFVGTVIGHYERLDGKRGVVLQQEGTKVVHVYGKKWLKPAEKGDEREAVPRQHPSDIAASLGYRACPPAALAHPPAEPAKAGLGGAWRSLDTAPEDEWVLLATTGEWVGEATMLIDEDTGAQKWRWARDAVHPSHVPLGWQPLPAALSAHPASQDGRAELEAELARAYQGSDLFHDLLKECEAGTGIFKTALQQIEGGNLDGITNLVLSGDWQSVVNLMQACARAALAGSKGGSE